MGSLKQIYKFAARLQAPAPPVVLAGALVCLLLFAPSQAPAQPTPDEPQYLVVEGDNVDLRCCEWSFGYPVGRLERGQVLVAVGMADESYEVKYPEGAVAQVEEADVEYLGERGVVRLLNASRLLAHNVSRTTPQSWKSLLARPLPAGTELSVQEVVKNSSGETTGYLVEAPEGARGFVDEQFVRAATEEEIRRFRSDEAIARGADGDAAERADGAADSSTEPMSQQADAADDEAVETVAANNARSPRPVDMASDEQEGEESGGEAADRQVASAAEDADADAQSDRRANGADRAASGAKSRRDGEPAEASDQPTLKMLDAAFDRIVAEPIEEAELTPLIGEYERMLKETPDTEAEQTLRRYLLSRIELLRIRAELQRDMRSLNDLEQSAMRGQEVITREMTGLSRRHQYVAVGRLSTSSLYDGRRLPLMYRLVSVAPGAGRTIAYIAPSEEIDLSGNLGNVVGILGERQTDENLRLNIIRATGVERLESAEADRAGQ